MFSHTPTFSGVELLVAFTALIACSPTPSITPILARLPRTPMPSTSQLRLPPRCTLLIQQKLNGRRSLCVYPPVVQYPLCRLPRHLRCDLFLAKPCGTQIPSARPASR